MTYSNGSTKGVALVTGGSGFIASHIIDSLLDDWFNVVTTARSEEKGRRIVESATPAKRSNLSYVVVGDVAKENAFDTAFTQGITFDYVVHTASPYHLNVQDPVKDFLDPAIKGTTGILKSIAAHAPTVKRVVITSSSAAMINPLNHAKVYDETCWAPWTWEDVKDPTRAYVVSKTLSEKAAWAFVEEEKPNFDLAVINCTYTFGPVQRNLPSLEGMNTSNHRIRDMLQGKMKGGMPSTAPVFTFVDVRDVARAHLKAITVPEAGGNRFYIVGGHFSNKWIVDSIRKWYPKFEGRLPPENAPDDFSDEVYTFNNSKSVKVLGLEYTSLEKSVKDTVKSILDLRPDI
ncbi:ketoreductase [Daldinia bambusicola]|nr:ketoreductase [Daldinia bambusicola]